MPKYFQFARRKDLTIQEKKITNLSDSAEVLTGKGLHQYKVRPDFLPLIHVWLIF